jgi:hypothetical protein
MSRAERVSLIKGVGYFIHVNQGDRLININLAPIYAQFPSASQELIRALFLLMSLDFRGAEGEANAAMDTTRDDEESAMSADAAEAATPSGETDTESAALLLLSAYPSYLLALLETGCILPGESASMVATADEQVYFQAVDAISCIGQALTLESQDLLNPNNVEIICTNFPDDLLSKLIEFIASSACAHATGDATTVVEELLTVILVILSKLLAHAPNSFKEKIVSDLATAPQNFTNILRLILSYDSLVASDCLSILRLLIPTAQAAAPITQAMTGQDQGVQAEVIAILSDSFHQQGQRAAFNAFNLARNLGVLAQLQASQASQAASQLFASLPPQPPLENAVQQGSLPRRN